MDIKFLKKNRTLIVKIQGEIDHHTCEKLRIETDNALEKMGGKNIIFQMDEVSFMDSSGIGVIIGRYKNIKKLDGKIAIAKPNERVVEIFNLVNLKALIPFFDNIEKALDYVQGGSI